MTSDLANRTTPPVDLGPIMERLRATFESGRTRPVEWRLGQLRAVERLCDEQEGEIAAALADDLGRPFAEAWFGDVAATKAEATYARKHVRRWMKRHRTSLSLTNLPGRGWYEYEPIGLVLVIVPWNYPFYLSLGPLVGAVAAGDCAVIKPSEHAPASSRLLAELVPRYLDAEAFAVVEGEADVTQDLLARAFDHVFFTGGAQVGRQVMQAAAETLTPVTLELGGKCPVIVTARADIAVAARRIAWVKLMNSGQTCIAPDYVLVERSVQQPLVDALGAAVEAFRADADGAGMRIVDRRHFDRLAGALAAASGTVAFGGRADADALTIEPTVVVDPAPDSALMEQEIFGPILPVVGVDTLDEAITFVRARPKPLAAYLFSRSTGESDRVLTQVVAGGVVVNHVAMHCLAPQLPFGGVGDSGTGAYHGQWGFERLSHRKAVLAKPSRPDLSLVYPPYTDAKLKVLRRFF